ncbi:putative F-box/LRR-repeat protein [Nymphaea thermarum]|nr:putative F-box/LRR-repeat protein [Nymphaea thermarum]
MVANTDQTGASFRKISGKPTPTGSGTSRKPVALQQFRVVDVKSFAGNEAESIWENLSLFMAHGETSIQLEIDTIKKFQLTLLLIKDTDLAFGKDDEGIQHQFNELEYIHVVQNHNITLQMSNPTKCRINSLPEIVMLHTICFLPIKAIVRCSILSRRWGYLYTANPIVEFDKDDFLEPVS